MTSELVSED